MHWDGGALKLGADVILANATFDTGRVGALFAAAFGAKIARTPPYLKCAIATKRRQCRISTS